MKLIGIIAEYNPFHNGHKYQIEKSKKLVGKDSAVICLMSGDFVQRGEAAIFSKYARAEAAIKGGADLVLELPVPWSVYSAEGFASGAVGLLGSLGCIDYLSFGSESGEIDTLNAIAVALLDPSSSAKIKNELDTGVSYAVARHRAMYKELGSMADLLKTPNNILAVEYLKAMYNFHFNINPITVQRKGTGHDEEGESASYIRSQIIKGNSIHQYVPSGVNEVIKREITRGRGPITMEKLEPLIISRFRMLDNNDFSELPDASEGLGNRLCAVAHEESRIDAILSGTKTKRYALSRIRRMCMCAALGVKDGEYPTIPPYARILAANSTGRKALRQIKDKSSIPVITKPASVKDLDQTCLKTFILNSRAHDLYVLSYRSVNEHRGNADWLIGPVII